MKRIKILAAILITVHSVFAQSRSETIDIPSGIFNEVRKVRIYLPEGYADYPNRKYTVAYLFDAQSDAFFNFIKATFDYLSSDGYISPTILVGISSGNRQFEFTPKPETVGGTKSFEKSGGAALLALHLKEEVLPAIEKKYRSNGYTIGIGHSLGGTFLTYALINYPEIFNAFIAVSPNYEYDNEQLVHKFDSLSKPQLLKNKFLYIAYGKGDMYEEKFKAGTQKIESLLSKKNIAGLKWQVKSMDNDSHGTTATEGIFKGMIALYREFSLPYERLTTFLNDSSKSFIKSVKKYYAVQTNWAGVQLPLVNDINGIGYNCFYSNKKTEAIAIFEWAISLYPGDVNLYDSMGEIQQASGNNKEALKYFSKGLVVLEQQRSQLPQETYERLVNGFKERIKYVGP
ncbi:MAG: alpha/beta hydrolase-fold protein [Bacteroidota bacterium]